MTEIDPINALQAAMEGYKVVTMEYAADKADIFVSATGNKDVITYAHMAAMKDQAIVCNIGHFDNEIDVAALDKCEWEEIKPQVDHVIFPDGKRIILLAKGRLVNLGCGTGHPSFVMSSSFANQTIAQIELFTHSDYYEAGKVYVLPKHLDEKVARLHLKKVGAMLSELSDEQAAYIGVRKQGPVQARHVQVLTPPKRLRRSPQGATRADRRSRIRRVRSMQRGPRASQGCALEIRHEVSTDQLRVLPAQHAGR